jgi:hypothetical protein
MIVGYQGLGIEFYLEVSVQSPGRFRAAGYRFHLHGIDEVQQLRQAGNRVPVATVHGIRLLRVCQSQLLILRFAFAILLTISISGRTS